MAKNMDPTMEDMRREQASLRAVWEQNGQKQLNAITVKLAEKENQTPIPVTMAGLRQLDRMASEMGMGGLKPVQKGAAGAQTARQVPVGMQSGRNPYVSPMPRADALGQSTPQHGVCPGEDKHSAPAVSRKASSYIQPNSPLQSSPQYGPYVEIGRGLSADLNMAYNTAKRDFGADQPGLKELKSDLPKPNPTLTALKNEQESLQQELIELERESREIVLRGQLGFGMDAEAFRGNYSKQQDIREKLRDFEQHIKEKKLEDIKTGEATHPFYSEEISATDPDRETKSQAKWISDQYKAIWYDILPGGGLSAYKALYPIIRQLSDGSEWANMIAHNLIRPEPDKDPDKAALNGDNTKPNRGLPGFNEYGYIVNQSEIKSRYGIGTSAANGCGWISAYNVLKALGEKNEPYDIMREMESGALMGGEKGTDPLYLVRYFRRKGYDANLYFTKEDVEREVQQSDASIYVYGYLSSGIIIKEETVPANIGAHFIAGYPVSANSGQMRFFNDSVPVSEGPLEEYYHSYDIFRFAICINKP